MKIEMSIEECMAAVNQAVREKDLVNHLYNEEMIDIADLGAALHTVYARLYQNLTGDTDA